MRRSVKVVVWVVGVLVALVVVLGIAADPLARYATRKALADVESFTSDFDEVSVGFFPLRYEITRLKTFEEPVRKDDEPLFYAERLEAHLSFWPLLAGRIVAEARIDGMKLTYLVRKPVKEEVAETAKSLEEPIRELVRALRESPPLRLDRLEILEGELLVVDEREATAPEIWIHGVELTVDNLASNRTLSRGEATLMAMAGTIQETGTLSLFVSADPLALPPHFAGRVQLRDLQLRELHELIAAKTDLTIPEGVFEMFATFTAREGSIEGGVKPMLREVDVDAVDDDLGDKLKAALADAAISLTESDRDEGEKVATVIPIRGTLDRPTAQLWPTVVGVLRNAFVVGLAGGFSNTPPDVAEKKESVVKQAEDALSRDEGPPQAQPVEKEDE